MTPVYICTGLLDSGKTNFIKDTLMEQDWLEKGRTLLILCEEGEYELEEAYLKQKNIVVETVDEMSQFTKEFEQSLQKKHKPKQIIIEFNGMWNLQEFLQMDFPKEWGLAGIYSTVNGSELELMMANMRNIFMNQLIESDLVVINRCPKDLKRAAFRKALKLQNPNAQLIFEAIDGTIMEFTEEDLPYDINADLIELDDCDYGTWYGDASENPERYHRKKISFLSQLFRPVGMPRNMFIPGRLIMACCAQDVRFYGFPCKTDSAFSFSQKSWAKVTVEFYVEKRRDPRTGAVEDVPLMRLVSKEDAEKPEEEVVTL